MNRKQRLAAPPQFSSITPASWRRWTLLVILVMLAVSILNQVYAEEIQDFLDNDTSLTIFNQE